MDSTIATFAMISLGCAKNQVNAEQMMYLLREAGYTILPSVEGADVVIINTCGFIDSAKSEAIDHILAMAELKAAGVKTAGIMATDGTVHSGVLENALREQGISAVLPSPERQADVMELIYGCVKAGKPLDMEKFFTVANELRQKGAEVIILGCTELSLFKRREIGPGFIDVLEVLAKRSIERCGGTVREEYLDLLRARGRS